MTRASDFVPLNGISRRTFCKGAAVLGIWGGLASFGLAGCAPRTRAERLASSAPWKAGTYTAEVTGRNAPYAMTVTFTERRARRLRPGQAPCPRPWRRA